MREAGFSERYCSRAALTAVGCYRERMREYEEMTALDVWYSHLNAALFVERAKTPAARKRWREDGSRGHAADTSEHEFPKIACIRHGRPRIVDRRSLIYHPRDLAVGKRVRRMFQKYRDTLPEERRTLLDRYELVDVARKVVGVGSVGHALRGCAADGRAARSSDPAIQGSA
jgi:hypothetical protein